MKELKKLAISWTTMWALSYIIVAFITPWTHPIFFILLGIYLIFISLLAALDTKHFLLSTAFFVSAVLMVFGGVASWTGVIIWDVPFASKEIFQVSMAFADFIAAAFMVYLSGETR